MKRRSLIKPGRPVWHMYAVGFVMRCGRPVWFRQWWECAHYIAGKSGND